MAVGKAKYDRLALDGVSPALDSWTGIEGARDNQLVHHQVVNKRAVGEEFDVLVGGGIRKGNRREFQVGSFGGITGGKSGVKRDKEVPVRAEHLGIRTYRVTLKAELKPGEYAFFMGTGQTNTMSSRRSGGAASGRIYDFSILE